MKVLTRGGGRTGRTRRRGRRAANLGALEIIGMAANGAQYGVMTVHYYWIGAVPAMVFLGIVTMPFYYGSGVRSVPEYLRLRFNRPTHLLNALSFAVAQVLIAGVNLYALALVMQALLGWPLWTAIVVGAFIVGAGIAFVTVAVVAAVVTPLTAAKRGDELRGLVYGMDGVDLKGDVLTGDEAWYRSPVLLGGIAVLLAALFYLPVF